MIECVPNVSEGRDLASVENMARAIRNVGCDVLDVHSDPDHHRSVFTLAGDRDAVLDGVFALAERAVAFIDLRWHKGVHPRSGALDVVPFVPLGSTTMGECVEVARQTGRRIASALELPVFLYGAAASIPARAALPDLRRHIAAVGVDGTARFDPDFGPRHVHPSAGVAILGARPLLVAYNVLLATAEIEVARAVAAAVREANGGLRGVRALGLMLASHSAAQVSMNLTDVSATTVPEAFRAVVREAARRGVGVAASEIVGLLPAAALAGASADELLTRDDPLDHVLERRLAEVER